MSTQRELTVRVIVLGLLLSVIMGAANVYVGLKVGMTVSASIPAAVLALLILQGVFRTSSTLEANQVQTAASAGESLAAGIIFTMPALVMIGAWDKFDFLTTTLVAFSGGLLGILFMIPMRRVFVVADNPDLRYPEGVACAKVLEAGQSGSDQRRNALAILLGTGLGAVFKVLGGFFHLFVDTLEKATRLGSGVGYIGGDVSPMLVAVGFIVRLHVAVLVFVGGAIAWLIALPLLGGGNAFDTPMDAAWGLWSSKVRYIGVGAMVVGGIASIFRVRHGLVQAVRELMSLGRPSASATTKNDDRDLPLGAILVVSMVTIVTIAALYYSLTKSWSISLLTLVIMVTMAFFFTAVASYIVGLVGNSNSPVSGMTITTVLFTGILLTVFNFSGQEGMVATLGVAAIVCCAACTSGDVCNDLKTGQLVGASPFRQQIMQIAGVAVASLVMAPVLQLLHDQYEFGGRELPAPQASLFRGLVEGFFGEDSSLPWSLVAIGACIGLLFLALDFVLGVRKSSFRIPLMPVAVGMYLPFGLAVPMLAGGLISAAITRGAKSDAAEQRLGRGIVFSSGVIAGEALVGVGLAMFAALGYEGYKDLVTNSGGKETLTAIAAVVIVILFCLGARPRQRAG